MKLVINSNGGQFVSKGNGLHEIELIVLEADRADNQNDAVTLQEMKKASAWFLENGRNLKINHSGFPLSKSEIQLSESFIKDGKWHIRLLVKSEELFTQLRVSGLSGASVGGRSEAGQRGNVRWLSNLEIEEISLLTDGYKPAVPSARVVSMKSQTPVTKQEAEAKFKEMIQELASVRQMLEPEPAPAPRPQPHQCDGYCSCFREWEASAERHANSARSHRNGAQEEANRAAEQRKRTRRVI
jgi:hypothetical protein